LQNQVLLELFTDVQTAGFVIFGRGLFAFLRGPVIGGDSFRCADTCFSNVTAVGVHHLFFLTVRFLKEFLHRVHRGVAFIDQLVGFVGIGSVGGAAAASPNHRNQ